MSNLKLTSGEQPILEVGYRFVTPRLNVCYAAVSRKSVNPRAL